MSIDTVFSFTAKSSDRLVDHIKATLDIGHIWDTSIAAQEIDVLVMVGGGSHFAGSELLAAAAHAIRHAREVVWISNDYGTGAPLVVTNAQSPYRACLRQRREDGRPDVNYWSTVTKFARQTEKSEYVNWNALGFDTRDLAKPYIHRAFPDQMIYFGFHRAGRTGYFDDYFMVPKVKTAVSYSATGASNRWFSKYPGIIHREKFTDLWESLSHYGLGLYIEDKKSHKEYHSPANRFYEMLSAGVPMTFQPQAVEMLKLGGYNVQQFAEIPTDTDTWVSWMHLQRSLWFEQAKSERRGVADCILEGWKKVKQ